MNPCDGEKKKKCINSKGGTFGFKGCSDCPSGPDYKLDDYFYFIYNQYILNKGGYHATPRGLSVKEFADIGKLAIAIENKQRSNAAIETANILLSSMNKRR